MWGCNSKKIISGFLFFIFLCLAFGLAGVFIHAQNSDSDTDHQTLTRNANKNNEYQVLWSSDLNFDQQTLLTKSGGIQYETKRNLLLEEPLKDDGSVFDGIKILAPISAPSSENDATAAKEVIAAIDVTKKFKKITQGKKETYEEYKKTVASQPLSYGVYLDETQQQTVVVNFGNVPGNGLKYQELIGSDPDVGTYAQNQAGRDKVDDAKKLLLNQSLGSDNAVGGAVLYYRVSTIHRYEPSVEDETKESKAVCTYTDQQGDSKTGTVTGNVILPGISRKTNVGKPQSAKLYFYDKDTGAFLANAGFSLEYKNEDESWVAAGNAKMTNADGQVEYTGLQPGTYRFICTTPSKGYDENVSFHKSEFVLSKTQTKGEIIYAAGTRKQYTITFYSQEGQSMDDLQETVPYGEKLSVPKRPLKQGYDFAGWFLDPLGTKTYDFSKGIEGDLKLYGKWVPGTGTKYRVKYFKQNDGNHQYSLAETKTFYGTTGALVNAADAKYPGYVQNTIYEKQVSSGTIEADGSLVLSLYYDRKTDTEYHVEYYIQDLNKKTYSLSGTQTKSGVTDSIVSEAAHVVAGFTENTTHPDRIATGKITGDGKLVLKIYYDRNINTKYEIQYYTKNLNESNYVLLKTEPKKGVTGAAVDIKKLTMPGYTRNPGNLNVDTGVIAGDGSMVLKAYFDENVKAVYQVQHYKQSDGAVTYTLSDTEYYQGNTGEKVQAVSKEYSGYTLAASNEQTKMQAVLRPDGQTILKLYYDQDARNGRQATMSVPVKKIWNGDGTGVAAGRPESVTIQLYANGQAAGAPEDISDEGNVWTYQWENLPMYGSDGAVIHYTVKEISPGDQYRTFYSKSADGTFMITDYYIGEGIISSGDCNFRVSCQIQGDQPVNQSRFSFTLTSVTAAAPMPENSANGRKTVSRSGCGDLSFGRIVFESEGLFYYQVRENDLSANGYTYDDSMFEIAVKSVRSKTGSFETLTTIQQNGQTKPGIIFANQYRLPNGTK